MLSKYFIQNDEKIESRNEIDELSNLLNSRVSKKKKKSNHKNINLDRFIKNYNAYANKLDNDENDDENEDINEDEDTNESKLMNLLINN